MSGRSPDGQLEELGHLRLPAGVDVGRLHAGDRRLEVLGLEVADQQPVLGEEQRVVAPAGRAQRVEHLRPHRRGGAPCTPRAGRAGRAAGSRRAPPQPTSAYSRPSSDATLRTSPATWPTPSATWCVGPSAHQRSKNSAGGSPKRRRLLVLPIRNVSPGIDSPSPTSSFSAPVGGLGAADDRDRAVADLQLDAQPGAALAVVELERAQRRLLLGDRDVRRARRGP